MPRSILAGALLLAAAWSMADDPPRLLQQPTLSRTAVVFSFAGDLWTVPRTGGEAVRLTNGPGAERRPRFSPDGESVAFTGEYDGNVDVYVVPAKGGVPRRLTAHPGADETVGFTPDGKSVLFRSTRDSAVGPPRLYTVPREGGLAAPLPLPRGTEGAFSADASRLAYVPHPQWQRAWKRYRGGQTTPIWIARLADSAVEKVPRESNSNDSNPLWFAERVYFLSDRSGKVALHSYDPATRTVSPVLASGVYDFKSASAGPDAIVLEEFGALHLFDPATARLTPVKVTVAADLAEVRPRRVTVNAEKVSNFALSPAGARAAFEVRGEILTVPAEKGDGRNLTSTPGLMEREPAWSPDGQRLAYLSEAGGEYALEIRDQKGGAPRRIGLGSPPSYYFRPRWSPDGKKIAYEDQRLNLWYVDVEKGGAPVKVDTNPFAFTRDFEAFWSPDSRFLAYTKDLPTRIRAAFVHSLADGKSRAITDGMADVRHPRFDRGGQHLYLTASTDIGPANSMGDLSQMRRPVTRLAYVVVLRRDEPSPLAPESDEEKEPGKEDDKSDAKAGGKPAGKAVGGEKGGAGDKGADKAPEKPVEVRIDFEGIEDRILALPAPARNYVDLQVGKEGFAYLVEAPVVSLGEGPDALVVHKLDLKARKVDKITEGVTAFLVAANGEKALLRRGEDFLIAALDEMKPGESSGGKPPLKLAALEVLVDPRAEWRQMYHEAWRIQRDFFYDPGHHGLDLEAAEKRYAPFVDGLASRADLNYLFEEMLGEMTVGHMFVSGGDQPEPKRVKGGLLGADYRVENGRYRIARVLSAGAWGPRSPLAGPGADAKSGEYLLAVSGRDLTAADDLDLFLEGTAGKAVVVKIGPAPDGRGAREATVVPLESEESLRAMSWIEANRRFVSEKSGGRVAYVYLPDTAGGGLAAFNREFFTQVDRQAAIIDERSNGGGYLADYVVDFLGRKPLARIATRDGLDRTSPEGALFGPKVMIIDEMAGSGGDAMPWYFRKAGLGKLVGKRTWGGLVGFAGNVPLIDGGFVASPSAAVYGLEGEWEVENVGVPPDVEVDLDPKAWRAGHDAQLEKALEVVLAELAKAPPPAFKRPAYPNYHRGGPGSK